MRSEIIKKKVKYMVGSDKMYLFAIEKGKNTVFCIIFNGDSCFAAKQKIFWHATMLRVGCISWRPSEKKKLIEEDTNQSNQKGKVNCFHASCALIAK